MSDASTLTIRDGDDAQADGSVALGGVGDAAGGAGGNGAIPSLAAQPGATASSMPGTGGGGGGLGRIRINTKDPTFTIPATGRAIGVYTSGPVGRE